MITSSLQPFCCCNPQTASCDQTGKVRITWQVQRADSFADYSRTVTQCYPVCTAVCGSAPTSGADCGAEIGGCRATAETIATSEPCDYSGFRRIAKNSQSMAPASLDFTFKGTAIQSTASAAWVYSADNGLTTTTTCMTFLGAREVDSYDDYVTTCWSLGAAGRCETMVSCSIGNNPSANCGTALIAVKYYHRAYYQTAPAPFTIKAQTTGASSARYYSVELVGAVRTFKLWNAANTNIYSLDISGLNLGQVQSTLDAQATIVCASLMAGTGAAQIATRALSANVIEARAFVPIPTTAQAAITVGLFAPGASTTWWQAESMCPSWSTTVGGAVLRLDSDPTRAFSQGYDDAAELMFCMGFETIAELNTEGATPNWYALEVNGTPEPWDYGYLGLGAYLPVKDVWTCSTTTWTSATAASYTSGTIIPRIVMGFWGTRSVPLGSGTSTGIDSDDFGTTYFNGTSVGYDCDFPTACTCCFNANPMFDGLNSQCVETYQCNSWITQGSFRLERIV